MKIARHFLDDQQHIGILFCLGIHSYFAIKGHIYILVSYDNGCRFVGFAIISIEGKLDNFWIIVSVYIAAAETDLVASVLVPTHIPHVVAIVAHFDDISMTVPHDSGLKIYQYCNVSQACMDTNLEPTRAVSTYHVTVSYTLLVGVSQSKIMSNFV